MLGFLSSAFVFFAFGFRFGGMTFLSGAFAALLTPCVLGRRCGCNSGNSFDDSRFSMVIGLLACGSLACGALAFDSSFHFFVCCSPACDRLAHGFSSQGFSA